MIPASRPSRSRVRQQLNRLVQAGENLDVGLVAALAGDRPITAEERRSLRQLRKRRGAAFYSDVLFILSHRYFPPERARGVWQTIVAHKKALATQLGRDPGIAVGALDFLVNFYGAEPEPTLAPAGMIARVAHVALTDGLTGLFDHATFDAKLDEELRRYHRYGDSFSLMMMDLDDFKRVNDTRGHVFGDKVLRVTAEVISKEIRDTDTAARYGGEEFVVVAPRTPLRQAELLAERIVVRVRRRFARSSKTTISVGISACPQHAEASEELLRRADRALYEAKGAGKGCVRVAVR